PASPSDRNDSRTAERLVRAGGKRTSGFHGARFFRNHEALRDGGSGYRFSGCFELPGRGRRRRTEIDSARAGTDDPEIGFDLSEGQGSSESRPGFHSGNPEQVRRAKRNTP